ncbi:phage-related protein [Sinorhizobium terangae]|uniref:Phage tail protein n=1 Tax=Sinorhizobium terangae TaxID=110322 RepID=A0A6N7LKS6_SINTE|nr:phage tail protein [Sinorhizobium terangae]MBB4184903.1 phage-related protein [Sinorhizobium terangae]MQX18412.1 phage tail protein [Sinorhizobium terangae]
MPLPTFTPPVAPSPGTSHAPTVNLWEAEFGDGYSQPTPKGINHIRRNVSLKWDALTYDQMRAVVGFFEDRGGNRPFYFQPYGEQTPRKWTCKEWTHSAQLPWQVTATFVQSFTTET